MTDDNDILDLIETAIDDSMDIDWTSRVGAEHVLRSIKREGMVIILESKLELLLGLSDHRKKMVADIYEMMSATEEFINVREEGEFGEGATVRRAPEHG